MEPLASLADVAFFSLQKGPGAAQISQRREAGSVLANVLVDWTAELEDLEETAALLMNLDLVISIDSAVAHLAGALGVATCVLLAFSADWRWLEHRETSPWYPTARLFRQESRGEWTGVLKRILREWDNSTMPAK